MNADDIHYSNVLYLDLEWTCWNVPPPPGMKPEVIEIGVVAMDMRTLSVTQEAAHFIRPRRWEISDKCTKLTGITADDIRSAKPLDEVLAAVTKKFQPANKACCAWGDDVSVLARTCKSLGLASPFRHPVDLSGTFQGIFVTKEQASLSAAIKMLGLDFDGVPHGALPDARNTARLHASILRRMRREPDPAPPPISEKEEVVSLSPFAQKLSECLK
jgi:inhibitor of KinA sporulation pathway (predicted exonuclease)